ncbi:hypothetical protein [Paeniglutamicibacter terrestris]|uniref:Uncharacterized protein n=1 Tax=Paeniglutamicibacter terrestris TaxID=2723403 RepID=A0ABX1G4A8_9MICC|nr:hypothetical protein [Paeniglutamicibacter terrestris]NKG21059.1 hypothetical protein [Paeniglutamicibacter terrestris]
MSDQFNPLGREYSPEEWAAARRVGLTTTQNAPWSQVMAGGINTSPGGPLLYATGSWHPDNARKETLKAMQAVTDWQIVENAMRREWKKGP